MLLLLFTEEWTHNPMMHGMSECPEGMPKFPKSFQMVGILSSLHSKRAACCLGLAGGVLLASVLIIISADKWWHFELLTLLKNMSMAESLKTENVLSLIAHPSITWINQTVTRISDMLKLFTCCYEWGECT